MNNERILKKRDVKLMQALQIYSGVFPTDMVHFQLNFAAKKETNRFVLIPVIGSIIKLIRMANFRLVESEPMMLLIMIDVKSNNPLPIEINMYMFGNNTMEYVPFLASDFHDYCVKIEAEGDLSGVLLEEKNEFWKIFSTSEPFDHTIENLARDIKIITPYRAIILAEDFLNINYKFHVNHGFKG